MLIWATIEGVFSLAAHAITITTENESTAVGYIAAAIFSNDMSLVDNTRKSSSTLTKLYSSLL